VAHNGNREPKKITLPLGKWKNALDSNVKAVAGTIDLPVIGSLILYQE
jgi:hypothetical protein